MRAYLVAHVGQGKMFLPSVRKAELLTENLPIIYENLPTHVWQVATYATRQTRACLIKFGKIYNI